MSVGLQVRLFGRVALLRDGRAGPVLPAKALELLCYLLLHRGRAHTRDALSGLLWPDAPDTQAKKYLRQTLWQLQANLANGGGPPRPALLDVAPGRVRLNPAAPYWCDVDVVEQAHRRCRDLPTVALRDDDAAALEQAVDLCQGDLLENWYQDWCVRERDRLHLVHLELLERLTEDCVARGALARGLAHGRRLLRLDPAREVTHRQVMRLYAAGGDRTGALRQFRRCVQALSQEFDLDPTPETIELYRQIRTGVVAPAPSTAASAAPHLDERLERIEATLAALHTEVRQLREAAAPFPFRPDEAVTPLLHPLPGTPDERNGWEAG